MSASTRTIQQPVSTGSVTSALAMAIIALAAALSISWGATNFVGKATVATPVQAPTLLDRGSRFEAAPQAGANHGAPGAYRPDVSSGGRGTRLAQ